MVNLPLPLLTAALALAAAVLLGRMDLGNRPANWLFATFFTVTALSEIMIGLRFGYGVEAIRPFQPIFPFFIGPLLFLSFRAMTRSRTGLAREVALHLSLAALIAILALLVIGSLDGIDIAIALSYLGYALAILWMWSRGSDFFATTRLELASKARRWSLWAGLLLFAFFIGDSLIALSFAFEQVDRAIAMISVGSFVLIGGLIALIIAISRRKLPANPAPRDASANHEHVALEAKARAFLESSELYLDTELTLDRLAKRLHVPARALSEAVNAQEAMNVSQYVNGFRVAHAARLLDESRLSVTKIAQASGFLTRSNFYREFQRLHDQSPASYRARPRT